MIRQDSWGVGVCLGTSGAVIALARSQPSRLVALANVTWPGGLWQHRGQDSPPQVVARRMLKQARRQLGLPRWCPVSVVIGPSLSDHVPEGVLAVSTDLLARAALSQSSVTTPDRAWALRHEAAVATAGALGAAAANDEAALAIGAAIANLAQVHALAHAGTPAPTPAPAPMAVAIPAPVPVPPPEPPPVPVAMPAPVPVARREPRPAPAPAVAEAAVAAVAEAEEEPGEATTVIPALALAPVPVVIPAPTPAVAPAPDPAPAAAAAAAADRSVAPAPAVTPVARPEVTTVAPGVWQVMAKTAPATPNQRER